MKSSQIITSLDTTGINATGKTVISANVSFNGVNSVTVLNITGAGVLMAYGFSDNVTAQQVVTKITIDGTVVQNFTGLGFGRVTYPQDIVMPCFYKFGSSCLVEMKLGGAGTAGYFAGSAIYV